MSWLDDFRAWFLPLWHGHGALGTFAVAGAALVAAFLLYAFTVRWVFPRLFRFAHEDPKSPAVQRLRVVLVVLFLLAAPAAFVLDRDLVGAWYGRFVLAAFLLLNVFVLAEVVIRLLQGLLARAGIGFPTLFRDILRIAIYVTAFMAVLRSIFGVGDLGALLGASAVFSIIIGLAVQDSLGNVIAGLFLQIDRPLKVGDWVRVNGVEGRVAEINWRSTRLVTRPNDFVSIPNNTISKADIVNYSAPTLLHRVERTIGVSYSAQPNKVKKILIEMMQEVRGVLREPAPEVHLVNYGASAIDYQLRWWIADYTQLEQLVDEVMTGIWYQFRRHGVVIPFPISTVYLRRDRREEEALSPEAGELLRKVDFLAPLTDPDLALLADDLDHHIYARGERVFAQGQDGHTFYIIWSGRVGVQVKNEHGAEVEVAELKRGDYFGEMSLLTGEARSATIVAKEDTDLLELGRASFSLLLKNNPAVAQAMSEIIARRIAATKAKVEEEEGRSTRARAAHAEEVQSMTRKIMSGIRGIFSFRDN